MKRLLFLLSSFILLSFKQSSEPVKAVELEYSSKILQKGKYVSVEGNVYFKKSGGILTTHLTKPFENITIINAQGNVNIYDPTANTIIQKNGGLGTSESSYFWQFLNGTYNDLGLAKNGYLIKSTKLEDGLLITNWGAKPNSSLSIPNVELVHEKNLPIFIAFINNKNKFVGKLFFSKYIKIGEINFPSRITEITYIPKSDSIVTTKSYTNPKINGAVNAKYLNYNIPANAKTIMQK